MVTETKISKSKKLVKNRNSQFRWFSNINLNVFIDDKPNLSSLSVKFPLVCYKNETVA